MAWLRSHPSNADPENVDPEIQARCELNREVTRQLYHEERIERLPQAKQQSELQGEEARRRKWVDNFMLASTIAFGSSSTGSASS